MHETNLLQRAQGSLLGQLAGDALGSLVEFQTPEAILRSYPGGVRFLADGGTWDTLAGQPTDDSEMALLLARMLIRNASYDQTSALKEYQYWLNSAPFDCGMTISSGLRGFPNPNSQANGAMMRISPLGIFGAGFALKHVAEWAMQDAALTHPNPICQQANALFAMGIAFALQTGCGPHNLYQHLQQWASDMPVDPGLLNIIDTALTSPPADYVHQQGWVFIAFHNALYQLLHAPTLEDGIVDTIMKGGDTDTNAAICGALLGAVYGREAVPEQWVNALPACRPAAGNPKVHHPRPECFWPVDVLELAEQLAAPQGV